jgi:hypothetical protein
MDIAQRLQVLRLHLNPRGEESPGDGGQGHLEATPCSAADHSLPRFDPSVMSRYLESNPLKNEVYETVKKHPELLPEVTEGMRKGKLACLTNFLLKVSLYILPSIWLLQYTFGGG